MIDRDTVLPPDFRAKNLTIHAGVVVSAPGDLVINASGKTVLDGVIRTGGKLTLINQGGMDVGPNGRLLPGGDVIIVSTPDLVPSQDEMDRGFSRGFEIGGARTRDLTRLAHSRDLFGNHEVLPPIVWAPGARRRNLWVNVLGTLDVGTGGTPAAPITYDFPDGAPGANRNGDNAKGEDGQDGGSAMIEADQIEITGAVTFNLGDGGDGGSAVAGPTTSAKAVAKGGNGGNTGHFVMATAFLGILHGININAPLTINFGRGGRGGDATATGLPGAHGSPGKPGESAKATGGNGGKGAFPGTAGDLVTGLARLTVTGNQGGAGGNATTTGGAGGNDNACPGTSGGGGGKATSIGGKGGDAVTSLTGGTAGAMADGPGGNGGDATANGGRGGDGMDCCDPVPQKGGNGGKGGDATATPGDPGQGQPIGAPGNPFGVAGNGGDGGDGKPPGKGGERGIGTQVPNGQPGVDGKECEEDEGCKKEEEPNDTEDDATPIDGPTQIGDEACGSGSLSDPFDKDHFKMLLGVGQYEISVPDAPMGSERFFLDIAGESFTPVLGAPITISIGAPETPVWIGFFGGHGSYKFRVKRLE